MARGLDHIVHAVRDLDAAAALYRSLGFTVGARNRHPREWGTQNHIIQTPDTFIELLAVADSDNIAPHAPRYFSFGAFNRDFLKRGEGLSMLVLKGIGAPDAEHFRAKGIGDFELYDFEREGKRPDGTPVKVAFSLAFASDHAADVGFFTCQQHYPENFWNPAFQKHANGASSVAGVVFAADEPERHRAFMEKFADASASQSRRRLQHRDAARGDRDDDAGCFRRPLRRQRAGHRARRAACRHPFYRRRRRPAAKCAGAGWNCRSLCRKCRGYRGRGCHGRGDGIRTWPLTLQATPLHGPAREDATVDQSLLPNATVTVGAVRFGNALPLALIAGPCALESRAHALEMASALKEIAARVGIGLVYKTVVRQGQPHLGEIARAASGLSRRCRFSPKSATG